MKKTPDLSTYSRRVLAQCRWRMSSFLASTLLMILLFVGCSSRLPPEYQDVLTYSTPTADESAIDQLTEDFLYGIKENNLPLLQAISEKSTWPRIEQWGKEHDAVICEYKLLDFLNYFEEIGGSRPNDLEQGYWQSGVGLILRCPQIRQGSRVQSLYDLYIEDLTIAKVDGIWKIVDWGNIEEDLD